MRCSHSSVLSLFTIALTPLWAACGDAPAAGDDELVVTEVAKDDASVACKANSGLEFDVVAADAGIGLSETREVRKIIKTRATFEKYFGEGAPDVDFGERWVYVWSAPQADAGDTLSIERLCVSSDGKALIARTLVTTLGARCEAGEARRQLVVSVLKPSGKITSARAVGEVAAGEACGEEDDAGVCAKFHAGETSDGEPVTFCDETFADRPFVRPPADVIVAGGVSKMILALDTVRGFAFDRRGTPYQILDKGGEPMRLDEESADFPSLHLPSNRGMYTFYAVQGVVGQRDDPNWGKLDTVAPTRIEPSIVLTGLAIDTKFLGAWEGVVSSRTGDNTYDFEAPMKLRVELTRKEKIEDLAVWSDGDVSLPDGERYKLLGSIANWDEPVRGADGECLPPIADNVDENPFFGGTDPSVDLFRLAAMHYPGDQVIVITYPPGVRELSINGMGGLDAFSTTDLFALKEGAGSGIRIMPHSTPNGHTLHLHPVSGGGGACR